MLRVLKLSSIIPSIARFTNVQLKMEQILSFIQRQNTLPGHNDVLAGVVVTDNADLYEKLFYNLNTTGAVLSPFDSYQLIRGLKTLSLRMERSTANAQEIVCFGTITCSQKVLYTGRGGMISFKVADEKRIPHILNTLKSILFCWKPGWCWKSDYLPNHSNPCRHSCRGSSFLWINRWPLALVYWYWGMLGIWLKICVKPWKDKTMGKYDFTTLPIVLDIIPTNGKKRETDRQVLPAWIADMDFEVLQFVRLSMTMLSN